MRLALGSAFAFLLNSLVLITVAYYLLNSTWQKSDHEAIQAKAKEYEVFFQENGTSGLKHIVENPDLRTEASTFFLRVADAQNKTLYLHMPELSEGFEKKKILEQLETSAAPEWISILRSHDEDAFEIFTLHLKSGATLQVGRSSELREDRLEDLRNLAVLLTLISLVISFCLGIVISRRALSPVRRLLRTIQAVRAGNVRARAPLENSIEFAELNNHFNEMLNRTESLIKGSRESLDNIAHDLRTPTARFRARAESALLSTHPTLLDLQEALQEGLEMSASMIDLLNALMDVSELEMGTLQLKQKPLNALQISEQVADLYSTLAPDSSASPSLATGEPRVRIEVSGRKDIKFSGDPVRVSQALANLVDNAMKYSEAHQLIQVAAEIQKNFVVFRVSDHGPGIPENELPFIWDRLYRGDHSRSKPGLGLGLSVVRGIALAHRGSVHVESRTGHGSAFEIHFPLS